MVQENETWLLQIGDQMASVQLPNHVQLFATPRATARQASLSINNSQSMLKLMPTEWVIIKLRYLDFAKGCLLVYFSRPQLEKKKKSDHFRNSHNLLSI